MPFSGVFAQMYPGTQRLSFSSWRSRRSVRLNNPQLPNKSNRKERKGKPRKNLHSLFAQGRPTAHDIDLYHGHDHLEKVHENAVRPSPGSVCALSLSSLHCNSPICSQAAKICTEARPSPRLNRGIHEIRGKEMERGSLPASAYFAYSAVTLGASVAVGRAVFFAV